MVRIPDGRIFILLREGIGQRDPETCKITLSAKTPSPINSGAYQKGRLY